jgi:hypothetical protein
MRKAWLAEWILGRFATCSNASAVLGDLEEARAAKGAMWFWRSFFSVLLSCAWRQLGGYMLSALGGGILLCYLQAAFFSSMSLHDWTAAQRAWGSSVALLSGLTGVVALYCFVRFGPKDILTKMAAVYTLLGAVACSLWWVSGVALAALVIAVAVGTVSLFTHMGRRGFAVLAAISALHLLIWPIALMLSMTVAKFLLHSEAAITALLFLAYFAAAGCLCAACSWLHSQFVKDRNSPMKGALAA